MPFSDSGTLFSAMDEELMIGASNGSDVTVEELVVTASPGGGDDIFAHYQDYQHITGGAEGPNGFDNWAERFAQEAAAFGRDHVTGDPNLAVYRAARDAMEALYATAKLNARPGEFPIDGPNGHTLTMTELFQSILKIEIRIGVPPDTRFDAYTDINGPNSIVYIDPNKLADDISGYGHDKGLNYTIFHELAHAIGDGRVDYNHPDKERIANEYGQVLAEQLGALYPSDTELNQSGGTVVR